MRQSVQIIGGKYRGKKLPFPNIRGLRPTPNRIRETLFNWLMHDIQGARCLDAFAGSGALGFEAFSRGATQVIFVESSHEAYTQLQRLASSFDSSALTVIHTQAEHYLPQSALCFDIVFLDPPFTTHDSSQYLALLAASHCLPSGGLVYLESPRQPVFNSSHWHEKKSKKAGQVIYSLYQKI